MNTNSAQACEIIYNYDGPCTGSVIQASVDKIEELFPDNKFLGLGKRASAAAIEMIQNIGFYSDEKTVIDGELIGVGTFLIKKMNGSFFIETKNKISSEKYNKFRDWINKLNSMSKDELKQMRKELLKNGALPGSRGANIGLLDIIRRNAPVSVSTEHSDSVIYLITSVQIVKE